MAETLPELVLLPGLDGTGTLFDRVDRRLAAAGVLAIALSYPTDPALTYRDYADFVRENIGTRQVVLLGESFSGPVAVMIAARMPDQIHGLILAATFLRTPWPGWLIRSGSKLNPRVLPNRIRDRVLMGAYGDLALAAKIEDIVASLPPLVRVGRLREVSRVDVRADFERVNCPILVLHGDDDWVVPGRQLRAAVRGKPIVQYASLPGAHMLLQTQHGLAASRIVSFLESIIR